MVKSILIAIRLPPQLKDEIDKLVKAGKFKNFSEAVREALARFLSESEKA